MTKSDKRVLVIISAVFVAATVGYALHIVPISTYRLDKDSVSCDDTGIKNKPYRLIKGETLSGVKNQIKANDRAYQEYRRTHSKADSLQIGRCVSPQVYKLYLL